MTKRSKYGIWPSVALSLFMISAMTTAVAYSPTLYRLFCVATGYGGAVAVNRSLETTKTSPGVGPAISVRFDTNVSPDLDWEFVPEERSVATHVGLPTTVFFRATNRSSETITARATYNVTPDAARMPVVFYVDPEMLTDIDSATIRTITLSYSFFRQDDEKTATARPLREGSEKQIEAFKTAKDAEFEPIEMHRQ